MRYYTEEDKEQAAQREIEVYRTAASLYAPIKRGLEKMDGKIMLADVQKQGDSEILDIYGLRCYLQRY